MRSLLVRIFVSFWAIIVITIVAAATLGYFYAERARAAMQNFEVSDAMLEASAALEENGRDGLAEWLRSLPGVTGSLVYILDERGRDLLGRRVPPPVAVAMRRFGGPGVRRWPPRDFGNLRPARPFTQLIGPDERVYTLFVLPSRGIVGRWFAERGGAGLMILALIVSAVVSYLLARAIAKPVRRFRESAIAIAGGNLDTRVADSVGRRRDEIGLLARDFDAMADKLQRAWQRQQELTRNVSHELRSPLARLKVALELARRKTGDLPELEKIDTETGRLDELIGQLLEYSRLDAGAREERLQVDLGELVRTVVDDVRFEYEDEGAIDYRSSASLVTLAYPKALGSALENVLRNAVRHNRGGEVTVALEQEGSQALITVDDRGGGVAENELAKIFEPFYRAGSRRTAGAARGTGLGLAIASRAVALNDGNITARNTDDGLRVEVRLPLVAGSGSGRG